MRAVDQLTHEAFAIPRRVWRRAGRRLRQELFGALARVTPIIGVENHGVVFLALTDRTGIGRAMFVRRKRPEIALLTRTLAILAARGFSTDQSTLIDVGANIGTTTLFGLTRHGFARALAFEPDPDNARMLAANVALNGLSDRVTVIEAAASDAVGQASFHRGRSDGTGRLADLADPASSVVEVNVTTIDRELQAHSIDPGSVGLLWVDVQGHEVAVLMGAESLLARRIPVVAAFRYGLRDRQTSTIASLGGLGYDRFVDLRASNIYGDDGQPVELPLEAVGTLRGSTDLLLLPAEVA